MLNTKKLGAMLFSIAMVIGTLVVSGNAQPGRAGWYGNNGNHYGWTRGRHRGWNKRDRRAARRYRNRIYRDRYYDDYDYDRDYRRRNSVSTLGVLGSILGISNGGYYNNNGYYNNGYYSNGYYGSRYSSSKARRKAMKRYYKAQRKAQKRAYRNSGYWY